MYHIDDALEPKRVNLVFLKKSFFLSNTLLVVDCGDHNGDVCYGAKWMTDDSSDVCMFFTLRPPQLEAEDSENGAVLVFKRNV